MLKLLGSGARLALRGASGVRGVSGARAESTVIAGAVDADADAALLTPDEEERLAVEKAIEVKRNKSRLNTKDFNMLHGKPPYDEPMHWCHYTVKYHRKRYGMYGNEARVDPALCWMTPEELDETLEYERVAHPFTVHQMIDSIREKKETQKREILEREREIDGKLSKLNKWIAEMEDRQQKKLAIATAAKEKKNRLIEEVRRHFGFTISPKDERFKTLLEEKEKEQKKKEKLAKRAAREAQVLLKLQQKSA